MCLGITFGLLGGKTARADGSGTALYAVEPPEAGRVGETSLLVQRFAQHAGQRLEPTASPGEEGQAPESSRASLEVLSNVERALLEARELSADLHEAAALRVLSSAEQALLDALALPGVHAFLAEVSIQLALCAAQLDEYGLFESALERALSLDPNRRIEAAEAPPAILQRARALARRHDLAPFSEGRIEVLLAHGTARFEAGPAAASAWLDGVRIATSDLTFRVRAGVHLLVVRARGHAPYATLLWLGPGKRPSQRIALSPSLPEIARLALNGAREPAVRERRARALALAASKDVYLFQLGQVLLARGTARFDGPRARALVQRCSALRCSQAVGLDETGEESRSFADAARARAWLNAAQPPPLPATDDGAPKRQERPIWKRWPLWTGSAALVLAGVVTAVWVTRPDHRAQQRSLEIDASALPR